jgi:sRNA-binding regulator protein Hfq
MTKRIMTPKQAEGASIVGSSAAALLEAPGPVHVQEPDQIQNQSEVRNGSAPEPATVTKPASLSKRSRSYAPADSVRHHIASATDDHVGNRQAELFYLQKQIQQQTPMIFILEDGSRIQGIVEWYDRNSIKVRGKSRVLIYKSAIKYLYKAGEIGSAPSV